MRLAIVGSGYESATQAFVDGNRVAAVCHDQLTGRLRGCAGMAGDDSTSTEFAAAYDECAREAVASLSDLVDSFAGLGRLTHASHDNHRHADARSVMAGATVYDGGELPAVGYVDVLPFTPPTSLGADSPVLPDKVGWILDHIEGFVWPGADVDRLRSAAGAWRAAAAQLVHLETCCAGAADAFWQERSPEIPLAIMATHDLKGSARSLGEQYAELASACDGYADSVEAKRTEIFALAEWLLEQVVEGVVISVAIGAITGGAGTAAGLSAVVARVAAESPAFLRILESLRALAAGVAGTVRGARDAVRATRLTLTKFKDAAVARSVARGEAGELRLWWARERGWLAKHEHSGSHTILKHVRMSDEQLATRFSGRKPPPLSSTFPDVETAESAIGELLTRRFDAIEKWVATGGGRLSLTSDLGWAVGRSMSPSGLVQPATRVRVVLVRDPKMPDGFRIFTAFPEP